MRYGLAIFLLSVSRLAGAAPDVAQGHIVAALKERYPAVTVDRVSESRWSGIYEVYTPDQLFYSNATGDLILVGAHMMDTRERVDLTAAAWSDATRIAFGTLPLSKAIKIVRGNGSRTFAIFEDPHCPFCQELEQGLPQLQDVTMYIFLLPLEQLHPGATETARRIWCSADRAAQWQEWMRTQVEPAASACAETPIDDIAHLAERLRIVSTPTLVLADGTRISGSLPAEALEKRLTKVNPTAPQAAPQVISKSNPR